MSAGGEKFTRNQLDEVFYDKMRDRHVDVKFHNNGWRLDWILNERPAYVQKYCSIQTKTKEQRSEKTEKVFEGNFVQNNEHSIV